MMIAVQTPRATIVYGLNTRSRTLVIVSNHSFFSFLEMVYPNSLSFRPPMLE